jgi:hypothetical protein
MDQIRSGDDAGMFEEAKKLAKKAMTSGSKDDVIA